MKKRTLSALSLAFFLIFSLLACAEPTPTPAPATVTNDPITETETDPTETATAVPEPTHTDTPEPEPTDEPTDVPTDTPQPEPAETPTAVPTEPVSYTITVDSPQPNQTIAVARDFTFSGSISPVPNQRLEIELVAQGSPSGSETLLAFAEVNATDGSWSITEAIHPRRTGRAMLHVRAAGTDVTVPVQLQFAADETNTFVTVNQPLMNDIVVAGQTLLISGESRNLIDNQIQIGLFGCPIDTDENLLAQIEFEAGNGPWQAQIILPQTAASDCDTARLHVTTGGLTSNDPLVTWASDQSLTLVTPSDEQANIFTLQGVQNLRFLPGRETVLVGTAVNPVNGQILVELVQNEVVLASSPAFPDPFGYWEATLVPPASADLGEAELRLSTGTDESYREFIIPTALGS